MILTDDTLFFRADHPNGFMFSAGNVAPTEAEGWYADPADIPPAPAPTYECSSMKAYAELVRTERQSSVQLATELRSTMQRLAAAASLVASLQTENIRLAEENAALKAAQGA
jgi:hypothetical protein